MCVCAFIICYSHSCPSLSSSHVAFCSVFIHKNVGSMKISNQYPLLPLLPFVGFSHIDEKRNATPKPKPKQHFIHRTALNPKQQVMLSNTAARTASRLGARRAMSDAAGPKMHKAKDAWKVISETRPVDPHPHVSC